MNYKRQIFWIALIVGLAVYPSQAVAASVWERIYSVFSRTPLIETMSLPDAMVGSAYSFQWTGSGGRPPYTWSPAANMPGGLVLSTAGLMTGTPTTAGAPTVSVKLTDSRGKYTTKALMLVVKPKLVPPPSPPVINCAAAPQNMTEGKFYSIACSISGGTPPYTVDVQGLPPGMTWNWDSATTGLIAGVYKGKSGAKFNLGAGR